MHLQKVKKLISGFKDVRGQLKDVTAKMTFFSHRRQRSDVRYQ